jgi:hypothetical protein
MLKEEQSDNKPTPNPREQLGIRLLAQNDEVVEIWFFTGCAFHAKKNESLRRRTVLFPTHHGNVGGYSQGINNKLDMPMPTMR